MSMGAPVSVIRTRAASLFLHILIIKQLVDACLNAHPSVSEEQGICRPVWSMV